MNSLFTKIIYDEVDKFVGEIEIVILLLSVVLSLAILCIVLINSYREKHVIDKVSRAMILLQVFVLMLGFASLNHMKASSAYNAYSEVIQITGAKTVEIKINEKFESFDLSKDYGRESREQKLADALSQVISQQGFKNVKSITQIADDRFEINYDCECGKVKTFVSE